MHRPTVAVVDLKTYAGNIRALCRTLSPETSVCAAVKADAYGHGIIPCSKAALAAGAHCLGVATVDEGIAVRRSSVIAPVIVFGGVFEENASAVVEYNLTQAVFSPDIIRALEVHAARMNKRVRVHIKVDSGMGRVGARTLAEVNALIEALHSSPHIVAEGVFTHFARADEREDDRIDDQLARFEKLIQPLERAGLCALRHAANSAAAIRSPRARYQMARLGIATYGYTAGAPVQPCMSWETRVVWLKEIEPGEGVSYGLEFIADRPTRVATLPVGYGDGYHRLIGNRGHVLIGGKRAPVIGRVCMDQIMADVTDIPGVEIGHQAVLMGRQGELAVTAEDIAGWCGTISYEVLCHVGARVPRVYRS